MPGVGSRLSTKQGIVPIMHRYVNKNANDNHAHLHEALMGFQIAFVEGGMMARRGILPGAMEFALGLFRLMCDAVSSRFTAAQMPANPRRPEPRQAPNCTISA